jgi:hypothetical protein
LAPAAALNIRFAHVSLHRKTASIIISPTSCVTSTRFFGSGRCA